MPAAVGSLAGGSSIPSEFSSSSELPNLLTGQNLISKEHYLLYLSGLLVTRDKKIKLNLAEARGTLLAFKFRKKSFRSGWILVLRELQEALSVSGFWSPLYKLCSQAGSLRTLWRRLPAAPSSDSTILAAVKEECLFPSHYKRRSRVESCWTDLRHVSVLDLIIVTEERGWTH